MAMKFETKWAITWSVCETFASVGWFLEMGHQMLPTEFFCK